MESIFLYQNITDTIATVITVIIGAILPPSFIIWLNFVFSCYIITSESEVIKKKKKIGESLLLDKDFLFENDFYRQNTNFNTGLEFYHALGVFTFNDKNRMCNIPNIDELICKNSKFKTYNEFLDASIKFTEKSLPEFFQT